MLSLSGMDGNYTYLTSDLAYDKNQITYNLGRERRCV